MTKRVAVFTHRHPEGIDEAVAALIAVAKNRDVELMFDIDEAERHNVVAGPGIVIGVDWEVDRPDLAIVFGGDGSILYSLRMFARTGVPTFGFNYGTIGFLASVERDQLDDGIERALSDDFDVLMLPALRVRADGIDLLAVNDVGFHRPRDARVAELAYSFAGEQVGHVRCDGLVVATPAGSTGYNLANNGPILAWGVEGFVVSFIAPHTLTARALVAAPGDELTVVNAAKRDEVEILIDGRTAGRMALGAGATVTFEDDVVALAQLPGATFYGRFRDKFGRLAS